MTRLLAPVLVAAALALAADSAWAQAPAVAPAPARVAAAPAAGSYYYSNGYYYYRPAAPTYTATQPYSPGRGTRSDSAPGYYSHNGVLRGPTGAFSGRVRHDFDPTGRPVQLHKPWLQPIR